MKHIYPAAFPDRDRKSVVCVLMSFSLIFIVSKPLGNACLCFYYNVKLTDCQDISRKFFFYLDPLTF